MLSAVEVSDGPLPCLASRKISGAKTRQVMAPQHRFVTSTEPKSSRSVTGGPEADACDSPLNDDGSDECGWSSCMV